MRKGLPSSITPTHSLRYLILLIRRFHNHTRTEHLDVHLSRSTSPLPWFATHRQHHVSLTLFVFHFLRDKEEENHSSLFL